MNSDPTEPKTPTKKGFFSRWRQRDEPAAEEQIKPTEEQEAEIEAQPEPAVVPETEIAAELETELEAQSEVAPIEEPEIEEQSSPETIEEEEKNKTTETEAAESEQPSKKRFSFGLSKTRQQLGKGLANLFLGKKEIDAELIEEIEMLLITADVGIETTQKIIDGLTEQVERRSLADADRLKQELRRLMIEILLPCQQPLEINREHKPHIIMVVGVNGVGKTTTIGKITHHLKQQGLDPLLAAGDTFRAAAAEQLTEWGTRNNTPVISQKAGSDSASVIYDAIHSAQSRGSDVVIADTAGRLHNKSHLMEELSKVVRVTQKLEPSAPHEILLVLDGGTGQNAISQTKTFLEAVPISGLVITKLDGTAKGGILLSLADSFKIPVRFVGLGESIEDLQTFNAEAYVDGLLQTEQAEPERQ